ncbi:unnamed protein product [Rotaria socialis]|uniref:Uncharacterized protein n=1 Tax=Rotaria socialis TaxID=392032 RepID=A0A817NKT2_9BILA|nr:unnamed protein product [Rotaria socialis]CAF3725064.1 unnamed protein product [Rotaria socialis]CAF4254607.1 unnamed protein product [Rotaria socialis]CAF4677089.1 unnamed protein product [Rotaria socialis]
MIDFQDSLTGRNIDPSCAFHFLLTSYRSQLQTFVTECFNYSKRRMLIKASSKIVNTPSTSDFLLFHIQRSCAIAAYVLNGFLALSICVALSILVLALIPIYLPSRDVSSASLDNK